MTRRSLRRLTCAASLGLLLGVAALASPPAAAAPLLRPTWTARYNTAGNRDVDRPAAVVADNAGNTYVTGSLVDRSRSLFLTIKYDDRGREVWRATFRQTGFAGGRPDKLALDAEGNVYVAGVVYEPGGNQHLALVKYSPAGQQVWTAFRDVSDAFGSRPIALHVASPSSIYLVARTEFSLADPFYTLVIKYGASGTPLWERPFTDAAGAPRLATATTLDASGRLYVSGGDWSELIAQRFITARYTEAGEPDLVVSTPLSQTTALPPASVAVDAAGSIYVTGTSDDPSTATVQGTFFTVKYSAAGAEVWTKHSSPGGATDAELDAQGNLLITGLGFAAGRQRTVVEKLNPAGEVLWTRTHRGSPTNDTDELPLLQVDAAGNAYVVRTLEEEPNRPVLLVQAVKYDPDGGTVWTSEYHGSLRLETVEAVAVDSAGNLRLTGLYGVSGAPRTGVDFGWLTLFYRATPTALAAPTGFSLSADEVKGGKPVRGAVTFAEGGEGGTVVVSSSHPEVIAPPPAGVSVRAGRTSATFTLRTQKVTALVEVRITVRSGGTAREATVLVTPRR